MKKNALFVFNGDAMCFIHVLLNALDMKAKGDEVRIVVEGAATRLVPELDAADHPLHALWEKVKKAGLVDGVCEACSRKMGTLDAARSAGLLPLNDMNGHPSLARYQRDGYEIITF
ncbi:DsrE family protein [Desulfococcus sp.]|uniref:DsrE family protein n=1 Tax=Desulfococcus sp. TaxID=2025834 RepID=UPI0035946840